MPTQESKHRRIAKQRRQYTLTRSKAILGFILSLCFSLALGPAFDKVARLIYLREKAKTLGISMPEHVAETKMSVSKQPPEESPREKLLRLQDRVSKAK